MSRMQFFPCFLLGLSIYSATGHLFIHSFTAGALSWAPVRSWPDLLPLGGLSPLKTTTLNHINWVQNRREDASITCWHVWAFIMLRNFIKEAGTINHWVGHNIQDQDQGSEFVLFALLGEKEIFFPLFSSSSSQEINIFKGQTWLHFSSWQLLKCRWILHQISSFPFCFGVSFILFHQHLHAGQWNAFEMSWWGKGIWLKCEALLNGQLISLLLACELGLGLRRQDV